MTKIKICGLKEAETFDTVINAGADYAGLVFYPPSPRFVSLSQAASLAQRARGQTKLIGLFVAPKIEEISTVLQFVELDGLQIYGSAETVSHLKSHFSLPIWRQLGVASPEDFPTEQEQSDQFVIEAKPPAGATRPGGNGLVADWALLAQFQTSRPWLLAGGLTPQNVTAALKQTGAPGVDVSSGVETAPGQKNPALIEQFILAARQA